MSKGALDDKINTEAELKERSGLVNGKNWLRHSGQAQRIDEMLLVGATTHEIALDLIKSGLFTKELYSAVARVKTHIFHLRHDEHKVPVKEDADGVWKFAFNRVIKKTPKFATQVHMPEVPFYGGEMIFNGYYELWDRCGVKLSEKIEMTPSVLDRVDQQNEVCDLIWAINAVKQSNKSPAHLSHTVMDEIKNLAPSLLTHKCFKKYSSPSDVVKRADRHYKGDHLQPSRFIQRQPKIGAILKNYSQNWPSPGVEMGKKPVKYIAETVCNVSTFIDYDDIKI